MVALTEVYSGSTRLLDLEQRLSQVLERLGEPTVSAMPEICDLSSEIAKSYRTQRQAILQEAALVGSDPTELLKELDTLQWLNRVAYHFCRIETHLAATSDEMLAHAD